MKRKREENESKIEKVHCFLQGLESFGMFVAASLSLKWNGDLSKLRRLVKPGSKVYSDFHNKVSEDLEKFLSRNDFTVEVRVKITLSCLNCVNIE